MFRSKYPKDSQDLNKRLQSLYERIVGKKYEPEYNSPVWHPGSYEPHYRRSDWPVRGDSELSLKLTKALFEELEGLYRYQEKPNSRVPKEGFVRSSIRSGYGTLSLRLAEIDSESFGEDYAIRRPNPDYKKATLNRLRHEGVKALVKIKEWQSQFNAEGIFEVFRFLWTERLYREAYDFLTGIDADFSFYVRDYTDCFLMFQDWKRAKQSLQEAAFFRKEKVIPVSLHRILLFSLDSEDDEVREIALKMIDPNWCYEWRKYFGISDWEFLSWSGYPVAVQRIIGHPNFPKIQEGIPDFSPEKIAQQKKKRFSLDSSRGIWERCHLEPWYQIRVAQNLSLIHI